MSLSPSTMFGLGLVASGAVAAFVLARPEPVPKELAPPPRSAAAQRPMASPSAEPVEADPADDPPPKGRAITRQDLDNALARVHARAMACRDEGPPPVVPLRIVIAPSGAVTSVGLPPELRGTPAGDCIARAMRQMSLPAWTPQPKVSSVEWSYPLRFDLAGKEP